MARSTTAPQPLPPERRTVGQLVAEALRLYGRRFWPSLALGAAPAALGVASAALAGWPRAAAVLVVGPVLLSGCLVAATVLALDSGRDRRRLALALAAGVPAFVPFVLARVVVFPGAYLLALAWFAVLGLAVPAVLVEGRGFLAALRRAVALARADLAHALGGVATLAIAIILASLVLFFLLASFGEQTLPVAAFLALLVLSPVFFLGSALLYGDQAARARARRDRAV